MTYRVLQWMTGDVGKVVGIPPTGVIATDDVEAITALDANCVFYTPVIMDDHFDVGLVAPRGSVRK